MKTLSIIGRYAPVLVMMFLMRKTPKFLFGTEKEVGTEFISA
jgi:hypothetical protein